MNEEERQHSLERSLSQLAHDINIDKFMLMEYLGPIVDGCCAALNVSLDKARDLHKMSDSEFEEYMSMSAGSFKDISFCFRTTDVQEQYSLVFDRGRVKVFDECIEPDAVITSTFEHLAKVLDADPNVSVIESLGSTVSVSGLDSTDVVQALGFLCYPTLLRMARSGVDPSSLMSDDADSIILAAASDMVTKIIKKWIDTLSEAMDEHS
ncbi:MAG: hypothetical protein JSW05_02960 [Candidatus Thorarchaeota archaeon]|nr:MAG: hypothetical protein JSW05_02960 [Candidatus Thorarchaeota archaeon]